MLFNDNIEALNTIRFINSTNRSVFLTGKAGTGKTTLLKHIVENTHKETVIAAPTGIAAINANGVTLHSLFQLPFGSFVPAEMFDYSSPNLQIYTRPQLLSKLQMNASKRNLLNKIELLIIDEVSMLRADLLDAIDTILRHVRRKRNKAFGGLQVLFIGDLLQLPPVVKDSEQSILNQFYKSSFFFDAKVFAEESPITIELGKIYRQSDAKFIGILNELRNNQLSEQSADELNLHCRSDFEIGKNDGYIFITTHNRKADTINNKELEALSGRQYNYNAETKKDFPEHMYPVEYTLQLKEGAQVMFLKNDYSGENKYFNGKIGIVDSLSNSSIKVRFNDGSYPVEVEKYTWENKRFKLNKSTNEIEEDLLGTFTHFPLKLAWAVTVHKSQGLTFKKAVIDVSDAFAPGQIYVALSRLESLDGLVLSAPIHFSGPSQSDRLLSFTSKRHEGHELDATYEQAAHAYMYESILDAFDFEKITWGIKYHIAGYNKDAGKSAKQGFHERALTLQTAFNPLVDISKSFQQQLHSIIGTQSIDHKKLEERVLAAQKYFTPLLQNLSQSVFDLIAEAESLKGTKAYVNELHDLELLFFNQLQKIDKAVILIHAVLQDEEITKSIIQNQQSYKFREQHRKTLVKKIETQKKEKKEKVDTKQLTYEMLQKGMKPQDIATKRNLTISTIEGHIAYYVATGILDARDFIDEQKLVEIIDTSVKQKTKSLKTLKDTLGGSFTYSEIKLALATMEME